MQYRFLGSSDIKVSIIGFGAWGIGGRTAGPTSYGDTDDAVSLAALDCALDHGITFYDTSPAYGDGHSEDLIGRAFGRGKRDQVVIATKIGIESWNSTPDYSPEAIRASVERSLCRLRSDYIDLLQFHNVPAEDLENNPALADEITHLVSTGKIRGWGVSLKSPADGVRVIDRHVPNSLQVNVNMLDMRAAQCGLLDHAQGAKVGLIARTPLCFGFLAGTITRNTKFPEGDHRRAWSARQIECWLDGANRMLNAVKKHSNIEHAAQTALRFCHGLPGISTVIPGLMTPAEVAINAAAGDLPAPTADEFAQICKINDEVDFFVSPT